MNPKPAEMNRSTVHALSPAQSCRDRGRQSFIFHTKRQLGQFARTVLQGEFNERIELGDVEMAAADATALMSTHPAFAAWSALNIGSQQQMWRALGDMIKRQSSSLAEAASAIDASSGAGSLTLNSDLPMPAYFQSTAYHGQPGGYCLDRGEDDWLAGALQEAGGTLYSRGAGTGARDSKGQAVVRFIEQTFPDFRPGSIVDLGCGYGGQTANYALAFPEAQTHGVDLGPGLLRYAHLRATALGLPIHYRQACASQTEFADESVDLVVSNILLHEIPADLLADVMRESYRIVKPGGLVVHQDVPTQKQDTPAFQQWLSQWQVAHNDEPFWQSFADTSVPEALIAAGFDEADTFEAYQPQIDGPLVWYMAGARKS